jgi:hypothetical protein
MQGMGISARSSDFGYGFEAVRIRVNYYSLQTTGLKQTQLMFFAKKKLAN